MTCDLAIPARRQTLITARAQLRLQYDAHQDASGLLRGHARVIDLLLKEAWEDLTMPAGTTLVAVGGYGRGRLYPYSDVDVLLLLPELPDAALEAKLTQFIGFCWDVGLEIGHSVRTLDECVAEAQKDLTIQTALIEARRITGNLPLFDELVEQIHATLDPVAFFHAKLLEQQQRHSRFYDASNLEPNIKETLGGLRDLHNISWICRACGLGFTWTDLAQQGFLTSREAALLRRYSNALSHLRIRLHYQLGRREDRLLFDVQNALAARYGLVDTESQRASQELMRHFYRTARGVSQLNTMLLQNLRARISPLPPSEPIILNTHFAARHGLLELRDPNLYEKHPPAILETFLVMQQHPWVQDIAAPTLRALWHAKRKINRAFRADPRNHQTFIEIFRQPQGLTHELRRMHRYGILSRYLPNFLRIVGQMQHDLFHVYTVDEHTLKVVRNLRRLTLVEFAHENPLCSRLMREFERPEVLYLAALFHDIAKGRGGDHSALGAVDATAFCLQHGLNTEDSALIIWLVKTHLVMSSTAQKQDISDPDVIAEFAAIVGNERYLTALYLLTVADIRGTSPKVWNAWKGKLLEGLYRATKRYLGGVVEPVDASIGQKQTEARSLLQLYALPAQAADALWARLEMPYFLRHDSNEMAWHVRAIRDVDTPKPLVRARLSPIGEGLQILIYAPDQQDLFARLCGFFGSKNYNIQDAQIYTTTHGYALDTFQILPPLDKMLHYRDLIGLIEFELSECLAKQAPLKPPSAGRLSRHMRHFPLQPEVSLQADEKSKYWRLSLVAGDRPGLLARIAATLAEFGLSVRMAKIDTLGERVEDSFLLQGESLQRQQTIFRLEQALLQQLAA